MFFFKTSLAIQGLLLFHMNFRMDLSTSPKNAIGLFIGIIMNLYTALGSIEIFIILSLPIYQHRMFSHLFVSVISFSNVLYFSMYKSFITLIKLIPKYFITLCFHNWDCSALVFVDGVTVYFCFCLYSSLNVQMMDITTLYGIKDVNVVLLT